jgi:hypothetical protein
LLILIFRVVAVPAAVVIVGVSGHKIALQAISAFVCRALVYAIVLQMQDVLLIPGVVGSEQFYLSL